MVAVAPRLHLLWNRGGAIGLFALVAAFSGSLLRATCPYCAANIATILNRAEGRQVRCENCSEYSTVNASLLRPLDPATTSDTPKFESPIFRNGAWPNACVACGEVPVRVDDLSKTTVGVLPAVMGHLQIVRGSVERNSLLRHAPRSTVAEDRYRQEVVSLLDLAPHDAPILGGEPEATDLLRAKAPSLRRAVDLAPDSG
jgi:hypothetical protein